MLTTTALCLASVNFQPCQQSNRVVINHINIYPMPVVPAEPIVAYFKATFLDEFKAGRMVAQFYLGPIKPLEDEVFDLCATGVKCPVEKNTTQTGIFDLRLGPAAAIAIGWTVNVVLNVENEQG